MKRLLLVLALPAVLFFSQPSDGRNYCWLTNFETSATFPNDIQRFFGRDTLWGPVHSNDWIATQNVAGLPVFYSAVSTSRPTFQNQSPNPAGRFLGGPPVFNAAEVRFPEVLTYIREEAEHNSLFFNQQGQEWRAEFEDFSVDLYDYPEGTPFDPDQAEFQSIDLTQFDRPVLFIDGKLDLKGDLAPDGIRVILGCSRDIRLIDNVMIAGTDQQSGALPEGATSALAIASEQSILIANTWENGRENRTQGSDIVITAYLFAIGGMFQFEQMNDLGDAYICPTPPTTDERGKIVLTGGITQYRRGYTHRSNHGGTGYSKVYHYDERLREWRVGVLEPFVDGDDFVSDADESGPLPENFKLSVYPNPFNAQATIAFDLPQAGHVSLRLFDLLGHEVATLLNEQRTAGVNNVSLSAADMPTGIYFASLESGEYHATQKLLLLK